MPRGATLKIRHEPCAQNALRQCENPWNADAWIDSKRRERALQIERVLPSELPVPAQRGDANAVNLVLKGWGAFENSLPQLTNCDTACHSLRHD